jgi:hypothetical protein
MLILFMLNPCPKLAYRSISVLEVARLLLNVFFRSEGCWRIADVHYGSDVLSVRDLIVVDLSTVPED